MWSAGSVSNFGLLAANEPYSEDEVIKYFGPRSVLSEAQSRANLREQAEILAAAGLEHPEQLQPEHIWRRVDDRTIENYEDIYDYLEPDDLVGGAIRTRSDEYGRRIARAWDSATAETF